jgi:anti-anti-sigma factor
MAVKLDEYDGVCVVSIVGDFSGEDVQAARKGAEDMIEARQIRDIVIDLEKAPFVDSEGLEALIWIKRRCEDLFGQFKLAAADENVRKVLEVTRLAKRFETVADVPGALKMMR